MIWDRQEEPTQMASPCCKSAVKEVTLSDPTRTRWFECMACGKRVKRINCKLIKD